MTDIAEYPEWVMLRDTMLHDDMGGLGQRIYTSAGSGYTKQKYIRADVVESLRQQLKIQEDAANHWFTEANNDHNRCVKLEQQLTEANETLKDHGEIQADLCRQLAECQAQVTELAEMFARCAQKRIEDEQQLAECQAKVKAAKREALLEAAAWFDEVEGYLETGKDNAAALQLRRMAKELE
jgi:chromosome segregation ATPase